MKTRREHALEWWKELGLQGLEQRRVFLKYYNPFARTQSSLTGSEIEDIYDKEIDASQPNKVEMAKAVLREAGYQVYNLWHVNDVMDKYECDEEEAMDALEEALTSEATMEQIHFAIREIAEFKGLNEKRR